MTRNREKDKPEAISVMEELGLALRAKHKSITMVALAGQVQMSFLQGLIQTSCALTPVANLTKITPLTISRASLHLGTPDFAQICGRHISTELRVACKDASTWYARPQPPAPPQVFFSCCLCSCQ